MIDFMFPSPVMSIHKLFRGRFITQDTEWLNPFAPYVSSLRLCVKRQLFSLEAQNNTQGANND
jgi:hypothetical protein